MSIRYQILIVHTMIQPRYQASRPDRSRRRYAETIRLLENPSRSREMRAEKRGTDQDAFFAETKRMVLKVVITTRMRPPVTEQGVD